jgi:hypothetical protein
MRTLSDIGTRADDLQARTADLQTRIINLQACFIDLQDREKERRDQGQLAVPRCRPQLTTTEELLDPLSPVKTAFYDRTEVPPSRHQLRSVVLLAHNLEGRDVLHSRPTLHHDEEDVLKATRAVRAACDDLRAFRASHHLQIPSSLSDVTKALDKFCAKLDVLSDSTGAPSVFHGYTLKQEGDFVETTLSYSIVHDMEATATYFKAMTLEGPVDMPATVSEQEYRNIKEMVDRYETVVSTMLSKHKECVPDESTG